MSRVCVRLSPRSAVSNLAQRVFFLKRNLVIESPAAGETAGADSGRRSQHPSGINY